MATTRRGDEETSEKSISDSVVSHLSHPERHHIPAGENRRNQRLDRRSAMTRWEGVRINDRSYEKDPPIERNHEKNGNVRPVNLEGGGSGGSARLERDREIGAVK
jgi:hypothetical protein